MPFKSRNRRIDPTPETQSQHGHKPPERHGRRSNQPIIDHRILYEEMDEIKKEELHYALIGHITRRTFGSQGIAHIFNNHKRAINKFNHNKLSFIL